MVPESWRRKEEERLTKRSVNHDLHGDLGRRVDSVVGVGLETRVHTASKGIARGIESRLGNGVVLAEEGEDDAVAHGSLELLRLEGEALGATDRNGVGCGGTACDARCDGTTIRRGRSLSGDDSWGSGSGTANDGLSDGHGAADDGGSGAATDVDPEEVDRPAITLVKTKELGELGDLSISRLDAVD